MSAARKHAPPQQKPAHEKPTGTRTKPAQKDAPRWRVVVAPPDPDHAETTAKPIPLERLRAASDPGLYRAPLPFRPALEAMFDETLPPLEVLTGPRVEAALDAQDAEAATRGDILFLRRDAPLPVVAHELTHALQARPARAQPPDMIRAETEAQGIEFRAASAAPLPPVTAALAPETIAFRMQGALVRPPDTESASEPAPEPPAPVSAIPTDAPPQPANDDAAPQTAPQTPAGDAAPVTALEAAPLPDLTAQTEAAAAAAEEATAALNAAQDADGVMTAFRAAPPSVKAREAPGLQARMEGASAQARAAEDATLPQLSAEMSPGEELPESSPVRPPDGIAQALEASPPPPAPMPELDLTPDPGRAAANDNLGPALEREFTVGDPHTLDGSFARMQTRDDQVDASAGERPDVPLTNDTDPERLGDQQSAAGTQAVTHQVGAARAVLDGPGPERAQLREMSEPVALPERAVLEPAPALPPVEGAADFAARELDAETVALFDQAHGPAMQASLSGAQDHLDRAADERDTARSAELRRVDEEQTRLHNEADHAQRDEVIARRGEIQTSRQQALDDQATGVQAMRDEAEGARGSARDDIDTEVTRAETRIDQDFAQAETEAQAEVAHGESDADAEREAARREADNTSWWDRALNWVKSQLERLGRAINAIFDAVRAAVRRIIDAVKAAALALIEAAAQLVKGIIETFGALLKGLVNTLLGELFPELAARLNAAIDRTVNLATSAIDRIAATLRRGIELLADALAAALDRFLAAWQAAVNAGLALVNAALSGDWAALARLILTPILMALGIEPEAFFQLFARAAQAVTLIADNPGGFISNLLDAVKGGIQRFGDNFRRHLIAGIIMWLTGPLGRGIVMPAEFNLWGLLDITRQVVGLTLQTVRSVAVRVLGEGAVQRIEYVLNYVRALITGGWAGLWEQLTSDLAMLRDMVLEQIRTFLVERVVIGAITWLASLFNPVGALVRLVMTIWNFIQFLRTNLAPIFQVAQTVINTIWEIASGALEGPIRGVESVLGRLIPVVLDLLMRLIPVSGIPERVQEVLGGVRLRIETALERLMRRVLAAFGIQGQQPQGPAEGQIMAPIRFRAGDESHTLLIEDEGETVRPVIRSAPTPLVQWLDGRLGQPFTDLAAQKNWRGAELATKRAELQALVDAAKAEEARLDSQAETTEDAVNAAKATGASDAIKAEAIAKAQATQVAGEVTKSAVARVLEFFGIQIVPLEQKFAAEIGAMTYSALKANLRQQVLPRLDAARYTPLDWAGFATTLAMDSAVTEPWQRAAGSTGAARRFTGGDFDAEVKRQAVEIATENGLANADAFFSQDGAINRLFANHLAEALNTATIRAQLTRRMLGLGTGPIGDWVSGFRPELTASVLRFINPGDKPDADIRENINAGNFVTRFEDAAAARGISYRYFSRQSPDGSAEGTAERTQPLVWFLRQNGSPRNGPNRKHVSTAIRAANPGHHEWIPTSLAHAAIESTAAAFETGGSLDSASGAANFIEFQHRVRTPTRNLIFKPGSFEGASGAPLHYVSRAHALSGKPYSALTEAERSSYYPPTARAFDAERTVPALQAHAGGLSGLVASDTSFTWTMLQGASTRWHMNLEARITTSIAGNIAMREMQVLRDQLLGYFEETIWQGGNDLSDTSFDLYRITGTDAISGYRDVKRFAARVYDRSYGNLRTIMDEVINS